MPFDERADFTGISDELNGVHISHVLHKASIEIDEIGGEAGVSTYAEMSDMFTLNLDEINFVCDRPFLFLIHEKKQNGILFLGKFTKPI